MSTERVPIYSRFNNPRTKHTLICDDNDILLGYERMLDPHFLVCQSNAYGCYSNWGYVSTRVRNFMSNSNHVAVGGLKYWSATNDLNGWITDDEKRSKYGNQWALHDAKRVKTHYYVWKAGSNDCDDLNAHLVDLKKNNSHADYIMKADVDSALWLEALKPHIKNFYLEILYRDRDAYICYLPIMPRFWWLSETRRFMNYMNYYVITKLGKEIGTKIKNIPCRSLYKTIDHASTNELVQDDIMTSFLEFDCVHLNKWGNEVMIHDLALSLVGNWGAARDGGRWGQRALARAARGREQSMWRYHPY